jgi:aspartokinase-like uncharacterized kinase
MATPGPWRIYANTLASFIQEMKADKARVISVTDVTGVSNTYSSLESLMKAFRLANEQAQQEDAATVTGGAYGCVKLTRNGQ